ncbi:HK97 gp10 family phage protein [Paenibacillus sp. FSL L8-0708]|uniref:HK97 gp10 family phage protein n=1 Tax=Paenibacillus sp. FSL L8-0708 TaxID=2975311 RepID=UPI0030F615FD
MARRSDIVGMKELEKAFKRLGKVPQTVATKAAKAGAQIAFKAVKQNAPVDGGDLKSGVILKAERRVKVGKKVYDIMMDPTKNDIFVKTSRVGKRSYYPASQEYGFMTVDGGYVPGFRYLRKGITENKRAIENKMVDVAGKAVDKALSAR